MRVAVGTSLVLGSMALYGRLAAKRNGVDNEIKRSITVGRSSGELFDAWLELLPQIMEPFASVSLNGRTSVRWAFHGSGQACYDTNISAVSTRWLTWRTSPDAKRPFGGTVDFKLAPQARGTELTLVFHARVPSALAGSAAMTALRRFKSLVETGEIASLGNNPSARRSTPLNEAEA